MVLDPEIIEALLCKFRRPFDINPLGPSDAYMRHQIKIKSLTLDSDSSQYYHSNEW